MARSGAENRDGEERARSWMRSLERWAADGGWSGTDPYDGLNAGRLTRPIRASRQGRRILTQAVKRSPVDIRPLLAIRPFRSAMALSLFASTYARDGGLEASDAKLRRVTSLLERMRCRDFAEPCWGYEFDVQTRVFFYPAGSPNTIATAFAGHAFLDAFLAGGDERHLGIAEGAAEFFLRNVPQTKAGDGAYFGYLPGDRTPIHNASMLVASLMARLRGVTGDSRLDEPVVAAIRHLLSCQRDDGSWPYGERSDLGWVDGFHTGYVLEALLRCTAAGLPGEAGLGRAVDEALDRGLSFYARALFDADGAPRYQPDSRYPIDAQCASQGIQTFALAEQLRGRGGEQARLILDYAYARLRTANGLMAFQRRRLWANRAPHMRWVVAPMVLALAHLESPGPGGQRAASAPGRAGRSPRGRGRRSPAGSDRGAVEPA